MASSGQKNDEREVGPYDTGIKNKTEPTITNVEHQNQASEAPQKDV